MCRPILFVCCFPLWWRSNTDFRPCYTSVLPLRDYFWQGFISGVKMDVVSSNAVMGMPLRHFLWPGSQASKHEHSLPCSLILLSNFTIVRFPQITEKNLSVLHSQRLFLLLKPILIYFNFLILLLLLWVILGILTRCLGLLQCCTKGNWLQRTNWESVLTISCYPLMLLHKGRITNLKEISEKSHENL